MIPCQRALFDMPRDVAYLNCAYMGPLMHRVVAAGAAGTMRKVRPWEIHASDFFAQSGEARALFARLINAAPETIAIVPSASYGVSVAARNVALARGQSVICLDDQFPSNVYPWQRLANEREAEMRIVPRQAATRSDGAIDWTPAVLDAIDERCGVVTLPHCHWTDGALIDLEAVGRAARAAGAALVLDITQSCGALPFDVERVKPDFLVAAGYKWLLGPYALAFLHVAPAHHGGVPLEENWITRDGSEDFAGLVSYTDAYQPGAQRFDMGERASFHLMPMAMAAMEQILEWGVDEIATTLRARTVAIAERAQVLGLTSGPADLRAGHFLGLGFPGAMPAGLPGRLAEHGVHVSVRGTSMRVTPHLYNDEEDIDLFFSVLEEALRQAA